APWRASLRMSCPERETMSARSALTITSHDQPLAQYGRYGVLYTHARTAVRSGKARSFAGHVRLPAGPTTAMLAASCPRRAADRIRAGFDRARRASARRDIGLPHPQPR